MLNERFKKEIFEDKICSEFIDLGKDIPEDSVINYLKTYFPDSCFSRNYTQYSSLSYDDIYEELYKTFRYEVLNWCGCGAPEEADKEVLKYLELIDNGKEPSVSIISDPVGWSKAMDDKIKRREELSKKYFNCTSIYDNPLLLCLAYTMDSAGFSEHGTSIGGAWITGRGKMYRYAIQKHLKNEEND